jgi:hypothetical protein
MLAPCNHDKVLILHIELKKRETTQDSKERITICNLLGAELDQ